MSMSFLVRKWRLNNALRDAQNMGTLTKVGTVLMSTGSCLYNACIHSSQPLNIFISAGF